jgi:putative flippase GtrA
VQAPSGTVGSVPQHSLPAPVDAQDPAVDGGLGADRAERLPSRTREVVTFLAVGGAGYVTDVAAFNWLRDRQLLGGHDPVFAKVVAVAVAMVVTYLGNRLLTWRGVASENRKREALLFVVFNLVGLMISVLLLTMSHDVLKLTSRLADNLVGNVLGVGLGTAFRFWSYRRFVFVDDPQRSTRQHRRDDPPPSKLDGHGC